MCKEISTKKLKEWMQKEDLQLIDVREEYEFKGGHIDGAKLMPLGSLQSRIREIRKEKPVVFICRSGSRSGMACQLATMMGFKDSYNMVGGMIAWQHDN